jgi:large subunit ribosomal protein L19
VKKRGDVRRAKLFYLREVSGKKARIREKKDWLSKKGIVVPSDGATESPAVSAEPPPAAAETSKE